MKTTKKFDCVEMKNAIQARLVARRKGMRPSEFMADVESSLSHSKEPIGDFWRKIRPGRTSSPRRHAVANG